MLRILRVSSVVVFIEDFIAAAHWWGRMTEAPIVRLPRSASLQLGDLELVFTPPDDRNPPGGSPLPYFEVDDFDHTRSWLSTWGCIEMHRPLSVPGGRQITQFRDPFGVIFGLEGPVPRNGPVWPEVDEDMAQLRSHYGIE
jgi:hypothetical protein